LESFGGYLSQKGAWAACMITGFGELLGQLCIVTRT